MAQPYQRLELKQFPTIAAKQTEENKFWKSFRFPIMTKNTAPVTSIDFCESDPYDFAVTAGLRVMVYGCASNQVKKKVTRFRNTAYGGSLKKDGKALLVGGENPNVQLFELSTKTVLRAFKGHTGAVRVTKFAPNGNSIVTASDDSTVRIWDVASGSSTAILKEHSDYVRCVAHTKSSNNMWATGAYDNTVKIWDSRTMGADGGDKSVMTLNHGDQVDALVVYPNGGTVISAGGNELKVWDLFAGGRLIHTFSNHQKTITTLFFNDENNRLFSGSLDRNLKVYDLKTYNVVHSSVYPSPILCAGLSKNSSHLVVGMSDGLLSIRHRSTKVTEEEEEERKRAPRPGTRRFYSRGGNFQGNSTDLRIESKKKKKMGAVNTDLKKYKYREAVQSAVKLRDANVLCTLFSELLQRGVLKTALSGRSAEELCPLLRMCDRYVVNPKFSFVIIMAVNVLLDIYGVILGQSDEVDRLFMSILQRVQREIKLQESLMMMSGSLEFVLNASQIGTVVNGVEGVEGKGKEKEEEEEAMEE